MSITVGSCYKTTGSVRVNEAKISFDSMHIRIDNFKESATAQKNHVSQDH